MKFLLDECISTRITAVLAEAGHDVVHVTALGLAGHIDDEVLAAARGERRVLVSADTDFGELLAKQALPLPSLVLFRQGNRSPGHQSGHALGNLAEVTDELEAGAIVVFTNDSIRIRRLPVGSEPSGSAASPEGCPLRRICHVSDTRADSIASPETVFPQVTTRVVLVGDTGFEPVQDSGAETGSDLRTYRSDLQFC